MMEPSAATAGPALRLGPGGSRLRAAVASATGLRPSRAVGTASLSPGRARARRGLRHRAGRLRRGARGRAGRARPRHRPVRPDGRCCSTASPGTTRCRTSASRAWTPRCSTCPMPASMSCCARSASCTCPIPSGPCARCGVSCGREVGWSSRCGESARGADGRRCFRSSMPRSPARCVRCSFGSASKTGSRVCAPMRSSKRSSNAASHRR